MAPYKVGYLVGSLAAGSALLGGAELETNLRAAC